MRLESSKMCQVRKEIQGANSNGSQVMYALQSYKMLPLEGKEGWIQNRSDSTVTIACRHVNGGQKEDHVLQPMAFLVFKDEVELTVMPPGVFPAKGQEDGTNDKQSNQ